MYIWWKSVFFIPNSLYSKWNKLRKKKKYRKREIRWGFLLMSLQWMNNLIHTIFLFLLLYFCWLLSAPSYTLSEKETFIWLRFFFFFILFWVWEIRVKVNTINRKLERLMLYACSCDTEKRAKEISIQFYILRRLPPISFQLFLFFCGYFESQSISRILFSFLHSSN